MWSWHVVIMWRLWRLQGIDRPSPPCPQPRSCMLSCNCVICSWFLSSALFLSRVHLHPCLTVLSTLLRLTALAHLCQPSAAVWLRHFCRYPMYVASALLFPSACTSARFLFLLPCFCLKWFSHSLFNASCIFLCVK